MSRPTAYPIRLVMFRPLCLYCGKPETYSATCDYQLGILACEEHKAWADNDSKAWLDRNRRVRAKDYIREPLFQETHILYIDVKVKRTGGTIDLEGWRIEDGENAYIQHIENIWAIPVRNNKIDRFKYIPLEDLKMSLPEDKHPLVDALDARLETGLYSAERLEYEKLYNASHEAPKEDPNIRVVVHKEYGVGRVFDPPEEYYTSAAFSKKMEDIALAKKFGLSASKLNK